MSTWQQHTLSNAVITNQKQLVQNHNTNSGLNSVITLENQGDINHTSSLSDDFSMLKSKYHFKRDLKQIDRKFVHFDKINLS